MRVLRAEVSETQRNLSLGLVFGLVWIGTCAQVMMMPRRAMGASPGSAAEHDGILARRSLVDAHKGSPRAASPSAARAADRVSRTDRAVRLPKAEAAARRPVLTRAALTPRAPLVLAAAPPRAPLQHEWGDVDPSGGPQSSAQSSTGNSAGALFLGFTRSEPGSAVSPARGEQPHDSGTDLGDGRDSGNSPDGTGAGRQTEGTPDPESLDAQMVVVGPASVLQGETVTFSIVAENVPSLSHAPLRLVYNADLLEFVSAEEGTFLSSGGAATQFLASESATPGLMDIAISRISPATGVRGSGSLCSVTFLAKETGDTPIVTLGSRLLDPRGRSVSFRRNDSHVAIK